MRFVFLIVTLWTAPLWAFDFDSLSTSIYCARSEACLNQPTNFMDQLKLSCEAEIQSLKCAELEKENPEIGPKLRKCDEASICRESKDYTFNKNQACMRGYKNALVDMAVDIKDMTFSLSGLVEQTWEQTKADQKQRHEFLEQCEHSIVCKRDLVKDDQRYNKLNDHDLESLTATFLFTEAQELKSYKASLERSRTKPYVPISERPRDETELSPEQSVKRHDLIKMAQEKIKKEYTKYSCYNAMAQEELECYVLGNIIDPAMVAGYFLKGARLASATAKLEKSGRELRAADEFSKTSTKASRAASREAFVKKYSSYSPTTPEQNRRWNEIADKGPSPTAKFLEVENSQMKALNDSLKNKNLVTSLTNYHKELLFKHIDELEKEFPGLKVDKYSDFKSSRFAFSGEIPKDLEKRMQEIFKQTNVEFSSYLKSQDIMRASDPAEDWMRAGWGNSRDLAQNLARHSRGQTENTMQVLTPEVEQVFNKKLATIESQRKTLTQELSRTSVVRDGTLDEDAFDIVRKGSGDTTKIKKALKERYGLSELSDGTVERIKDYSRQVDDFSPGNYIEMREFATLNGSAHGGLSADMIGLGAANLRGTAEALSRSSTFESAMVEARQSERLVTRDLLQQKKAFEKTVSEVLPAKVKTICSGDDCVGVLSGHISRAEKNKLVSELAKTRFGGRYRVAFVTDKVKDEAVRDSLATHGEGIEKNLRTALSGSMDSRKLKGLTFAADMQTRELSRGPVDLIIGEAPGVTLTKEEKKLIQQKFNNALIDLNNKLAETGQPGHYTPTTNGGW